MKKFKKILLLLMLTFFITGCTKQMKSADGKVIKSQETNQVLVENILCQPEELREEYQQAIENKKNDYDKKYADGDISKKEYNNQIKKLLDLEKLPICSKISIVEGGYENLWTSFFVKPLAWIMVKSGKILFNNYGLAIILITLLIRLILFPLTYKSLKQTENMKKAQPKINNIEKKYANKNDQQSMMQKSNEIMMVYKEYNINPLSGCLMSFLQIPLFFAFYEALNRLPVLFEGKFLNLRMGMTPLAGANSGNYIYLILPVLVGLVTYFSFKMNKNNMGSNQDQMKQMNTMFNIMIIMIFITSFSMSTSIIIYWISSSLFTIIQNLIIKRSNKK